MTTLRAVLAEAEKSKSAVGHFNVSELVAFKAVVAVARELQLPVLIGVSESEREFIGVRQIAALVASVRAEFGLPVFLNADHTSSLSKAREAAKAGFDSVVFDRSALPFEQNIRETKEAVVEIKSINPAMIVEGEIGNIGSGSEIHAEAPQSAQVLSTPEEAREFVSSTGVDVLAPAVGNMHGLLPGMVRGDVEKRLNIDRIRELKAAVGIPMTLHGGSGTNDNDLRAAVQAGMRVVHINTEIRLAWRKGLEKGLAEKPAEVAPYKILPAALESVTEVVRAKMKLFLGDQRAAR